MNTATSIDCTEKNSVQHLQCVRHKQLDSKHKYIHTLCISLTKRVKSYAPKEQLVYLDTQTK